MSHHFTLLHVLFWFAISILQVVILKNSKMKTLSIVMTYLLSQSLALLMMAILSSTRIYSIAYYVLSISECLFLSLASIEISSLLIPSMTKLIQRVGPFVIAIPTFCICILFFPLRITLVDFMTNSIRVSEVAFILSLALLSFCTAFESEKNEAKKLAKSYMLLLGLLVGCAEIQMRLGVYGIKMLDNIALTNLIRNMWPIAWLIGLSAVAISTCKKTQFENFKAMTNGV